jgi:hypothetical protein
MTDIIEDERILDILKKYSEGDMSAADAAYDIQALRIPGFENPSASEVIIWSKDAGFGIPTPSDEEVQEQVARILARTGQKDKLN